MSPTRQFFLLLLSLSILISSASFVSPQPAYFYKHDLNKLMMTDHYKKQSFSSHRDTGDWVWKEHKTSDQYNYDGIAKQWVDANSNESWTYDNAEEIWNNDTGEEVSQRLLPWKEGANNWTLEDSLDNTSAVSWVYNSAKKQWTEENRGDIWVGSHEVDSSGPGNTGSFLWTHVNTGHVWKYIDDGTGRWKSQDTGDTWRQDNSVDGITWENSTTGSTWRYQAEGNSHVWVLYSELSLLEVTETPTELIWEYNVLRDEWRNDNAAETAENIIPLFPPTPMAIQRKIISDAEAKYINGTHYVFGSTDPYYLYSTAGAGHAGTYIENGILRTETGDTITFIETTKVRGDIEIKPEDDLLVMIGQTDTSSDVVIEPFIDSGSSGDPAHIIFNPPFGKEITVNVLSNLKLQGRGKNSGASVAPSELFFTVRGSGTVRFRLPSGNDIILQSPEGAEEDGKQAGVSWNILMDQTKADAIDLHNSQLIFEKWSYTSDYYLGTDSVNTDTGMHSKIIIGNNSYIGFISENTEGISESNYPGYGSLCFDPSNAGKGRLVLEILKSNGEYFTDGGFNIYGNRVKPAYQNQVDNNYIRSKRTLGVDSYGVSYNERAGIRAIMRITGDVAFRDLVSSQTNPLERDAINWHARGADDRRGLVILNHNASFPVLASNYQQADKKSLSTWGVRNSYQNGFVLGINGEIEIEHNLFLDYIGGAKNSALRSLHGDPSVIRADQTLMRNPSALIIDGLAEYSGTEGDTAWNNLYQNTENSGGQSLITLQGTSGLFIRSGASSSTGVILESSYTSTAESGDGSPEEFISGVIGTGVYDGSYIQLYETLTNKTVRRSVHQGIQVDKTGDPVLFDSEGNPAQLSGEYALDIEGPLKIISEYGTFGEPADGFINMPVCALDYRGQILPEVVSIPTGEKD